MVACSSKIDGSMFKNSGLTGFGGLIRAHDNVDPPCILHGLDLCWSTGCRRVMLFRWFMIHLMFSQIR